MEPSRCRVCNNAADKTCSACHSVSYCSLEHQKKDWREHKKSCRIYVIKKNDVLGRYVVAARDIPAGTIIMDDHPVAYGPKQNTRPICLGCYKLVNGSYKCTKCQLPLCGKACQEVPMHRDNECEIFAGSNINIKISSYDVPHPIYECILTVRCLQLRERNPKEWQRLLTLEPHNDHRRTLTDLWHRNEVNTVKFLRERCGMTDFDEDLIHSVLGFADVNCFEIRSDGTQICGLYPAIAMMAHECVSNTHHAVTPDFRMVLRSVVPIKKGDTITTVYTHTLAGTMERRLYIKESKFFDCVCVRCADPTEMGTHFSSIKCQQCTPGYVLPLRPLEVNSDWKCNECGSIMSIEGVNQITDNIKEEMDGVQEGPEVIPRLERLLENHSGKTLHRNHNLLITMVHSLSELYGRVAGWMIDDLSMESLKRKETHCRHLLSVLDIIEPGMSRIRGLTLYELHAALYFIAQRESRQGIIDSVQLKMKLEEVLRALREARDILSFDFPNTPEGVIAQTIGTSIEGVQLVMKHCCE